MSEINENEFNKSIGSESSFVPLWKYVLRVFLLVCQFYLIGIFLAGVSLGYTTMAAYFPWSPSVLYPYLNLSALTQFHALAYAVILNVLHAFVLHFAFFNLATYVFKVDFLYKGLLSYGGSGLFLAICLLTSLFCALALRKHANFWRIFIGSAMIYGPFGVITIVIRFIILPLCSQFTTDLQRLLFRCLAFPVIIDLTFFAARMSLRLIPDPLRPSLVHSPLYGMALYANLVGRFMLVSFDSQLMSTLTSVLLGIIEVLTRLTAPIRDRFISQCVCGKRRGQIPFKSTHVNLFRRELIFSDLICEVNAILSSPLIVYIYQRLKPLFVFGAAPFGTTSPESVVIGVFVQLGIEFLTDFVCLVIECAPRFVSHAKYSPSASDNRRPSVVEFAPEGGPKEKDSRPPTPSPAGTPTSSGMLPPAEDMVLEDVEAGIGVAPYEPKGKVVVSRVISSGVEMIQLPALEQLPEPVVLAVPEKGGSWMVELRADLHATFRSTNKWHFIIPKILFALIIPLHFTTIFLEYPSAGTCGGMSTPPESLCECAFRLRAEFCPS